MKGRFLANLIVGLAALTGVGVYAASNAAVRTAGVGLLCTILLKITELGRIIYGILVGH